MNAQSFIEQRDKLLGGQHWSDDQSSLCEALDEYAALSISTAIVLPKNSRYEIQHFDSADGGRSWHVYDTIERHHIHTATHGFLSEDKSEPICCTKICAALNIMENIIQHIKKSNVTRYPLQCDE